MRGARCEEGIVRGSVRGIRARNGAIIKVACARPPALCSTMAQSGCRRRCALI